MFAQVCWILYLQDSPTGRKNVKLVEVPAGGRYVPSQPSLAAENVRVDKAISEFIKPLSELKVAPLEVKFLRDSI